MSGSRDVVVDTNVPIGANGGQPHLTDECVLACVRRLREIVARGTLVLDLSDLIFEEYRRYLNPSGRPGVGDEFLRWINDNRYNEDSCALVEITPDGERGFKEFPTASELTAFDRSDRKFVATSIARGGVPIAVASDRGWTAHALALDRAGVDVEFVCS